MTDKGLYQHIRNLVIQQRGKQVIDIKHDNFAEEYCESQMLKKKQMKSKQNKKISHLFTNFKNVTSYINVVDIINKMHLKPENGELLEDVIEQQRLPQILPKSIQLKIKQELGPIFNKKYEEDGVKRQQMIHELKQSIDWTNSNLLPENTYLKEVLSAMKENKLTQSMDLIDVLRKDIKKKQIYLTQKKFDKQIEDINKIPKKIQQTKLFHKVCSYLHMVLEQEHKEKWASKQERKIREIYRGQNSQRKKIAIPDLLRTTSNSILRPNMQQKKYQTRYQSVLKNQSHLEHKKVMSSTCQFEFIKINKCLFQQEINPIQEEKQQKAQLIETAKKLKSKKQLYKDFTFRKRGVKVGLMAKINDFVDNVNQEEKKNVEVSKKFCKALQSLSEEIRNSYGKFQRQDIAQDQDIEEMKKYLDGTLSRNKNDLKKYHHR